MPFVVFILILAFVSMATLTLFVASLVERDSFCAFLGFILLIILVAVSAWMCGSSNKLKANPSIDKSITCPLLSEKLKDGSTKQYIITPEDFYMNITKMTGKVFPEGTIVKCDWYNRSRYGVDWTETTQVGSTKDPVLSFVFPIDRKAEKE